MRINILCMCQELSFSSHSTVVIYCKCRLFSTSHCAKHQATFQETFLCTRSFIFHMKFLLNFYESKKQLDCLKLPFSSYTSINPSLVKQRPTSAQRQPQQFLIQSSHQTCSTLFCLPAGLNNVNLKRKHIDELASITGGCRRTYNCYFKYLRK